MRVALAARGDGAARRRTRGRDNGTTDRVTGILESPTTPVHVCQAPLPISPATSGRIAVTG